MDRPSILEQILAECRQPGAIDPNRVPMLAAALRLAISQAELRIRIAQASFRSSPASSPLTRCSIEIISENEARIRLYDEALDALQTLL